MSLIDRYYDEVCLERQSGGDIHLYMPVIATTLRLSLVLI